MKRVLLVEDSALVRNIVCDALQTCFPCVATVVEDGAQAYEELRRNSYHLVVTDIVMPVMDGLTLARKVRQELRSDVPIIMLTSITAENVRQKASEAGASAFLTKPIDYNKLIQVVERLVLPELGREDSGSGEEGVENL
ncbi:MAG: response regulator [bacterium]|nr:response regulator [bacterium]MDT8395477.1 response regulator [bacterium]